MAHASALGRCTHHLAGQQTMPSAGDAVVCSPQATHCAPPADIGWAGGSGVGCRYWRRHLGGSLPLFSGVNAARVARTIHAYQVIQANGIVRATLAVALATSVICIHGMRSDAAIMD